MIRWIKLKYENCWEIYLNSDWKEIVVFTSQETKVKINLTNGNICNDCLF